MYKVIFWINAGKQGKHSYKIHPTHRYRTQRIADAVQMVLRTSGGDNGREVVVTINAYSCMYIIIIFHGTFHRNCRRATVKLNEPAKQINL